MNLYVKFRNFQYVRKQRKIYGRFKNCSLPYHFWDEKRDALKWVRYDKKNGYYETNVQIFEHLGDLSLASLTYDYQANFFDYNRDKLENHILNTHSHDFDSVIRDLYNYPESFKVPNNCLNEYSEQQLRYLKRVQNYLLLIGLKDFTLSKEQVFLLKKTDELYDKQRKTKSIIDKINYIKCEKQLQKIRVKEELARCENSNILKYADCFYMHIDNKDVLNAMLNEKINYRIFRYLGSKVGRKYFLVDKDENYYGLIEFFEEEKIKFKDLKANMLEYKIRGYKNFKEYKEKLYNDFLEDSKWYKEEFNEETEILYAKFKAIEKF